MISLQTVSSIFHHQTPTPASLRVRLKTRWVPGIPRGLRDALNPPWAQVGTWQTKPRPSLLVMSNVSLPSNSEAQVAGDSVDVGDGDNSYNQITGCAGKSSKYSSLPGKQE